MGGKEYKGRKEVRAYQKEHSAEEIARRTAVWLETRARVHDLPDNNPRTVQPVQATSSSLNACDHSYSRISLDACVAEVKQNSVDCLTSELYEENGALRIKNELLAGNLEREKQANDAHLIEIRDLTLRNDELLAEVGRLQKSRLGEVRSAARSKPRLSDTPWRQLDYRTRGKYKSQVLSILKPLASRKDGTISEEDLRLIMIDIWNVICPNSSLFPSLSPSEDLQMMKLTRMTWDDREELQRFLTQHDCNVLSPYNRVWLLNKQHISTANEYYENGDLPLEHKAKDGEKLVGPSGYCRVRREKLIDLIVHECERHERSGCMDYTGRFDGEIWIAYMSDKGSDSTKAGLAIINTKHANSPFFVIPFATWYGEECYRNQELVIGELMKDLGQIKKINVMNTERNVLLHGVSDFSARNVLLGQKGPSHSNPCTECEYEKAAGLAPIGIRMRTEERRKECLDLYERLVEEGEKEEDAARASKGICKPPIVPISPSNFCVASVHLATGPGARALSLVESKALSLDLANAGCTSKLEEMKDRKEMEAKFQGSIDSSISLSKAASLEVDDCGRLLIALSQTKSNCDGECAASYCVKGNLTRGSGKLRRKSVWNTDTCSVCKRGFHFACSLTLSSESENANKMSCPSCKGWTRDSYATQVKLQLEILKKNLREKEQYANHVTSDNRKLIEIVRGKGNYFSQVKLFLASKGVSRSNWFQAYSGREVREALKDENVGLLFGILGMEKKGDLWDALISIRNILSLAKPAFLSEDEMESLKESVTLFSSSYRSLFPRADQSVKAHYISSHLLTYATLYNTIGLISEQSIEHFHALFNRYQRQFRSLASPGKKLQRIMCEHLVICRIGYAGQRMIEGDMVVRRRKRKLYPEIEEEEDRREECENLLQTFPRVVRADGREERRDQRRDERRIDRRSGDVVVRSDRDVNRNSEDGTVKRRDNRSHPYSSQRPATYSSVSNFNRNNDNVRRGQLMRPINNRSMEEQQTTSRSELSRSVTSLPLHSIPPLLPLHSLASPLIVPLLLHSQLQSSLLSSFLAASLTGQNSFQQVNNIHFHHS